MSFYELIARKRNGLTISAAEIKNIIEDYTHDRIPDYQMSAFLMAVYFQGMNDTETHALTKSMLHSGETIDLRSIPGIKVDKHSTGGVGDKVSIILAPIVAAAGIPVPMISGRGLGHTGGTLDKLESIPGFKTDLTIREFVQNVKSQGLCLAGQSDTLVPADQKLYALRDVTATIESIPLVVASILSKKLAEGIDALVLDVKTGTGAFMQEKKRAQELAATMIRVGEEAGVRTVAIITSMEQPLGNNVGNWLEIVECIEAFHGKGPADLMELTHRLAGTMIQLGGKTESLEKGEALSRQMINSGKAWEKFMEMVQAQQGDENSLIYPQQYYQGAEKYVVKAERNGYVSEMNAHHIGMSSVLLGAGRSRVDDVVDPAAGIILHKKRGDFIKKDEPLMTLYASDSSKLESGLQKIIEAVTYSDEAPPEKPLILHYMDRDTLY
jgi:pyrimidine-nucleoside phosphorylase